MRAASIIAGMSKQLRLFLFAAALSAVSLSACGAAGEPQPILSTAVPAIVETPLPTSLPPTPTLEPTPTVDPQVILRLADRYLLNGYYENAVATYQALLGQDGVPDEMRAAATFGLGQSALREGFFAEAVDALTTLITQYPQDARAALAHFLRGDAYLGLSRWAEAIADFQHYLASRPGLIDSYAHERIGDAQLALGQSAEALASYQRAVDSSRSLVPWLALRERVAQVYLDAGRVADAVAQYDAILEVAQNAPYRAGIAFLAAQALINSGTPEDLADGVSRMEAIFRDYPARPEAYAAMGILDANGRVLDNLARGRVAFLYGDYQGAIEALNRYSTQRTLSEVPAEVHLILGRAYREIGNNAAAMTAFQTVIDQYTTDPAFGEALLEQGRTRFLDGDVQGAIDQYMRIADTYDYLPEAPEALWRAGFLHATNEQPSQARLIFERLADAYPDSDQAEDGLFLAASAAYNANDMSGAERFYAELAAKATGEEQASAFLWVGRLALQRGDSAIAEQALRQAVQAAPDSYFSARAQDIAIGRAPFSPPASYRFQFDDVAQVTEAENWLRATFGIEQESPLWPLSPELEQDPRIIRGRELWAAAAYAEARGEFDGIIDAYESDALASYQLAIFLRGLAAYQSSIVAAANVIRAGNVGTLQAPAYIAQMRYPPYYLDLVQDVAQRRGFDPLLMFALIRHESLFDTNATAAAGEKGLTQVIPPTGEYIAGALQWPNYQHSDLFRPYAGIEFGAFYLSEQLRAFDNNVTAALAGYNAGPGRAATWLSVSGGDPDLFMTAITIDSTRLYVQRIYSYYNIYRALYGVD